MNWNTASFNWNQVMSFLATVEEGSLSVAARVLGLTQPTLSRQIDCLEEILGVILFERSRTSMTLTQPEAAMGISLTYITHCVTCDKDFVRRA